MAHDEAYYQAEKKIKQARRSGVTFLELNFNKLKLTELPESLKQLTKLEALSLSGNKLTTLPEWFGNLTQLKALYLHDNHLTVLPAVLSNLSQLEHLELAYNRLTTLPEWFGNLTQLEVLHLGYNRLTVLPECLGKFTHLQWLRLEGNQLSDIPSSLIQLEHLSDLDLQLILRDNPLNPELDAAYKQGLKAVKAYLRAKAAATRASKSMHERKLKVFLCHASQDKPIVHKLYQRFTAEGWIEPWLDTKKLLPGQDWQAEIKNAVEAADNVIIFLSNTSINKDGFIQKELRLAKDIALEKTEESIFLIPLRLDNCEVPRSLQIYQWANYFGEEKEQSYCNLLASLKLRLEDILRKEARLGFTSNAI